MKTVSTLFTRLIVFCSAVAFFTACVEDDDFDAPVIPPAQELEEILSEGGSNANFVSCLNEDFENYDDDVTSFDAYENVTTHDTRLWTTDSFSGNSYLKLSAYKAKNYVYSYFVIPVNFDKADEFSFTTQDRYFTKGNPLKVFIVENYKIEDNIAKAKMTDITNEFTFATGTTGSSTKAKVPSGIYNLSSFQGNGFIAFKYEGDGASVTTTIHLDDIQITDKDDADCKNGGSTNPTDGCGGSSAEAKGCLTEDFESYNENITSFNQFFNASQKGAEKSWQIRTFGGNKYIQMSAFKSAEEDDWFIVPVDFDKADEFSFETKAGFDNGKVLNVYTSTEHDGSCGITINQWTDITSSFDIATGPSTGYATDYTPSKAYSLSSLTGKGYIAFRYEGNGNGGKTTTMQIDNIKITDKDDSDCSGTTNPTDPVQTHKGGDNSSTTSCLHEDFEAEMTDKTTFPKYETISISNDEDETFWIQKEFGGNKYIEHSAFKKGKQDDWFLVEVNFDKADQMSFETKDGFDNGKVLTVLYSTVHQKGNDVNDSNWVDITSEFTISSGSEKYGEAFIKSGKYLFPTSVSGNGYIAFRYQGDGNAGLTTTMQIDNINIVDVDDKACYGEKEECSKEEFNSFNKNDTTLTGYQIVNTKGTRKWTINEIDGNKLIEETAFNNGAISSWFILGVDFDQTGSFQFDSKDGSNNGQVLTIHYSTDYDENGDPTKATWTNITSKFKIANDAPSDSFASKFTSSGAYNFQNLSGKGYIAFKYDGEEDKGATTTMQIDNIRFGKKDENSTSCTFNLKELTTTPTAQIHKGGEDAQPLGCYNLDFKDVAKNTDSFKTFEIVSVKGDDKLWKSNVYENNSFLEISGYQVGNQDDWVLINVDFDKADTFSFKTQDGYNNGQPLTVWYSTSHTKGDDITENNWTEITSNFDIANSAPGNGYSDSFTDSKEFSLSGISGNGFIAFRYRGGNNQITTTMRIDEVKITDKDDSTCNRTTPPPTSTQTHKGGQTAEPKGCYKEDFSDMEKDNDVFDEFETVSVLGDDAFWKVGRYTQENNFFAQFSAYQKENQDDWFLMNVDFDKADTFEFKTKDGFNNGLVLNIYYSTTHSKGADIQENQWTKITSEFDIAKDAPGNTYADAFTDSKQYSLANISGQGFIAFRYEGGGDSNITTLMQIDDIKIIDNDDSSCGTTPPTTGGNVTDKLFFSEYAEGAGNDKYIEIYNPTTDEIDLTRYELRLSGNNDSDWTSTRKYTFAEGKTLSGKTVYSIANPQANDDIKAKATDVKGGITFFNGDDALGLFFDADGDGTFESLLDIIGVKTNDPGKGWDVAGVAEATFDHTLVRKDSIEKGNPDWTNSAGTNTDDSEWVVKDKGNFNSLGVR